MSDLRRILPSFPATNFAALLPTIENQSLTTTDLLTLHPADIAKQTHLPLLDLKRLIAAIQVSLSDSLTPHTIPLVNPAPSTSESGSSPSSPWPSFISTLDPDLDAALGGGIPTGRITEFAGESGAGKTQFLLSLCLAVQLPPPHGLARQALYISTESGLSTSRLAQMLRANPTLTHDVDVADRPSLDNILSAALPDLESQDHILQYQVPVLLERHRIGLIVVDSVAANYRAEFERQGPASRGSNMAARSNDLVRLGALLRDFARRHDLAVVVANQVADRFSSSSSSWSPSIMRSQPPRPSSGAPLPATQETPLASRSRPLHQASLPSTPPSPLPFSLPDEPPAPPVLGFDHQQRWFTGWGDDPHSSYSLKTPSLGLVWSSQIACRIALFKRPVYGQPRRTAPPVMANDANADYDGEGDVTGPTLRTWRRWMKVVFAPHAPASGQGTDGAVEFEITLGGLEAVKPKDHKQVSRGDNG
ncbi:DNA repair protein rhp57 [Amphichorda felina]